MSWSDFNKETQKKPEKRAGGASALKGVVAGVVVVLGATVAWLVLAPKADTVKPTDTKPAKVKKVKPSPAPKVVPTPVVAPTNAIRKVEKPKEEYVKRAGQMQLPDGRILTFPPPKEGETRKVYAYGHTYECDHLGNFKDITKRKLFKTAFELNFLGLAQEGKAYIPAFLKGLEEADVRKMLEKPYEPIGDETEEEQAALKAYDNMRNAALDYMSQGGKFDDFVDEYAKFDRKQRETRAMGLREIMTLYKQGKVQEAKDMATAASKLMEKNGFKPVRLPPHVKQAFDQLP